MGEEASYDLEFEDEKNLENVIFISYSPFDKPIGIEKDNFYQIGLNNIDIEKRNNFWLFQ